MTLTPLVFPLVFSLVLVQMRKAIAQRPFAEKSQVVHRRKSIGIVFIQSGHTEHEMLAVDTESLLQGQIAVNVVPKFTALALNA